MLRIFLNCTPGECSDYMKANYARGGDVEREGRRIFGDTTYDLMKAYEARGYAVDFLPWQTRRGGGPVPFKKRFSDKDERPLQPRRIVVPDTSKW